MQREVSTSQQSDILGNDTNGDCRLVMVMVMVMAMVVFWLIGA